MKVMFLLPYFLINIFYIDTLPPIEISFSQEVYTVINLPFSADILFISSFFFIIGNIFSREILDLKFSYTHLLICSAVFILCHYLFNNTIDLNYRKYDGVFITTIQAFTGIYIILSISIALKNVKKISVFISYIGQASLLILILHFPLGRAPISRIIDFGDNAFLFESIEKTILGITLPFLIYILIKKYDFLAIFILPIKNNDYATKLRHKILRL